MKIDRYVIMVSGGPDSMALLDKYYQMGNELIVAHVNYQKRKTALRDEKIVIKYCESNNIQYEILKPLFDHNSNFQAWARDVRYKFAMDLAAKNNITKILVAHQLDDFLETYLMQKKRGSVPSYYGISKEIYFDKYIIIRPLLDLTKDQLEQYCIEHKIDYGIDESNLSDDYQRNRIRHSIIEKMSLKEKKEMYLSIEIENQNKIDKENYYNNFISENKFIDLNGFKNIEDKHMFLRMMINKSLSDSYLNELIYQLINTNKVTIPFNKKTLIKEYDLIYLMPAISNYKYQISKVSYLDTDYFKIKNTGNSFQAVSVSEDDFPITIRNYQDGDKIKMVYGTKKISRWFIDHKILTCNRKKWPIVLNANNEIILVPSIGCNFSHYSNNPSFFVIQ